MRVALKRPFRDGTVDVDRRRAPAQAAPLEARSARSPALRAGAHRYAGVLAPAATLRPLVIAPLPDDPPEDDLESAPAPLPYDGHRCRYRPWAELWSATFGVDVEVCPGCGSRMKLLALVRDPEGIARFLTALGLPTTAPPLAPARAPPYWQSRVLRRKAEQDRQHSLDPAT